MAASEASGWLRGEAYRRVGVLAKWASLRLPYGLGHVGSAGRLVAALVRSRSKSHEMPDTNRHSEPTSGALLTAEEVAALLRVTPAWVYTETRRNHIPHVRLGRYVRYRADALAEWMDELERRARAASVRHDGHRCQLLRSS